MEEYQIQYKWSHIDDKWRFWPMGSFPSVNEEMQSRLARLRSCNKDTEFRIVKVRIVKAIEVVKE